MADVRRARRRPAGLTAPRCLALPRRAAPRPPRYAGRKAGPFCVTALRVLLVLLALPACMGPGANSVLDVQVGQAPGQAERLWPVPPDVPRYRFVGELIGQPNIRPAEADETGGASRVRRWLRVAWLWITGLGEGAGDSVVLQRPQSGATDAQGRVYVTDVSRRAVFVFDPVQGALHLWEYADERRRFVAPVGVAFDHEGHLLVTDAELAEVFRFSADGSFLDSFGAGLLRRPTGIAFDPLQRHIYVADTDADDVKIFSTDGRLLDTLGFSGTAAGRLNRPVYLAFAAGQLYVSDALNARIQVFDREGNSTAVIGRRGLYVGNLTRPKGVAVDGEGHIYVVEGFYDHLLVFEDDGRFLMAIGGTGQGPGQFYLPTGVWTDGGTRIYVADMFNGRVSIFQFLGEEQ